MTKTPSKLKDGNAVLDEGTVQKMFSFVAKTFSKVLKQKQADLLISFLNEFDRLMESTPIPKALVGQKGSVVRNKAIAACNEVYSSLLVQFKVDEPEEDETPSESVGSGKKSKKKKIITEYEDDDVVLTTTMTTNTTSLSDATFVPVNPNVRLLKLSQTIAGDLAQVA